MIESYPLHWPPGRPRTEEHRRKHSHFQTGRGKAIAGLLTELRRLDAKNVIISTNIRTYVKGGQEISYASQTVEDPGVAVYFDMKGNSRCFALDLYRDVADNIHAIELTIAALRGIERWGGGEMMDAAFKGFLALPSPDMVMVAAPQWFTGQETPEELKTKFRGLAKEMHPDVGGDPSLFSEMKRQYEQFRRSG